MQRNYVWVSEHVWPDSTLSEPENAERLQQEVALLGEWEAAQRHAERAGISRPPLGIEKNRQVARAVRAPRPPLSDAFVTSIRTASPR